VLRENIYSLNNVNSSYNNLLKKLTLNFFNELRKNITNQDIKNEINRLENENNISYTPTDNLTFKFIEK